MNVLCINGNILDLDQLVTAREERGHLQLTFRNGDQVPLHWRDLNEKQDILRTIRESHSIEAGPSN